VVLSREVVDHEAGPGDQTSPLLTAARILDRIEWTFADLGDLAGAAEPLLTLAMNLTGRDAAWLGRFGPRGDIETLATLATRPELEIRRLPATVLTDARRINQPHLLTTREHEGHNHRLVVPLGNAPEGLLVLEAPQPGAPSGQELLRLASSLGAVVWHRLQETTERLRLRDELERLRFHGSGTHHALLASARLQALREALRNLSSSDDPVLLIGEEGTEREELARYRHAESTRQQAPFVSWNASRCAAGRHAEELFGSDATTGLWQQAAAGTLLIDHAGLLSIAVQRQLARALQRRHGDAPGPSLVLAATPTTPLVGCPELLAACREPLLIPPLRTDARDILALAELFLSELGSGPDGSPRLLSERSKRLLVAYPWPGNVRELRLVLESASAQAGGQPISPRHLPPSIANDPTAGTADVPTLEAVERQHILDVMQRTGGNRTRAAQLLGIANSTLYEKLKRYCIEP
jgi:transcriptional regulator with GAF, ATPase, and Fis domain